MKFKLTISALIVAVAACSRAAESEHGDEGLRKRGLVLGDQPLLLAEETPANTADVVVANDSAPVVPAVVAGAQAPTVLLDSSSFANIRNAPLGFVQMQQAPVGGQQFMLSTGAGGGPAFAAGGVQRFVDAPQIFIQAQPAALSSAAPITIIQAMTTASIVVPATPATSTAVALSAALTTPTAAAATSASVAPGSTSVAAVAAASTTALAATTPAAAPAPAPVAVPGAPAAAPVAPAAVPVAPASPIAPVAYQGALPAYAPAAALAPPSYSDMVLIPQPGLAGVAEPQAAPVYAQQQLYPVAAAPIGQSAAAQALAQAALQPATQPGLTALLAKEAAAAAAAANVLPTAIISGANASGSQAIVPIDQSLADLLTQSLAAAGAQKTGAAAAALARASALANVDDDSTDASQSSAAEDDAAVTDDASTSHRRQKPSAKSANALARARKSKLDADSAADASADPDADASASAAAAAAASDTANADDSGNDTLPESSSIKRKPAAKTASAKKAAVRSTMDDDTDTQLASGLHFRTSIAVDNDDSALTDASAVDSATDASYIRQLGSRQRGSNANIKEEAARAKAEASAEAREAVLSEVRAEASAEAALQASAELHLSPLSVVHDEAALMERETDTPLATQQFTREYTREYARSSSFTDEGAVASKAPEADSAFGPVPAESDRSAAWDAPRGGARSAYSEETPYYHAYEQAYSDSQDKYTREQLPYTDLAKESSMSGDWKVHYNGPSPTMYATTEEPSYTSYYNSEPRSYCSDSYKLHYIDEYGDSSSSSKPFNFVNVHADSAFARDAASATSAWDSLAAAATPTTNGPHAVNDLDPLSYGTQACSFRNTLPLDASPNYTPFSAHTNIVVLGVPQPTVVPAMTMVSAAPATATSTLMVTKYMTPALKVVYGSSE
ncbi:hypothetical protein GGI20_001287 [Coemansia sp. BCRC 34301]|nr:hypothetical protein GGI20_001287 [Coemansia sp. BCRC 34301]